MLWRLWLLVVTDGQTEDELEETNVVEWKKHMIFISDIDILSFSITFKWYIDTTSIGCGAPALLDSPKLRCSSFKMKTQTFFHLYYFITQFFNWTFVRFIDRNSISVKNPELCPFKCLMHTSQTLTYYDQYIVWISDWAEKPV